MKLLFIGAYDSSDIILAPVKVAKNLFFALKQKVSKIYYITYFDDGKKYSRYQKLFGKEKIDNNIYRLGVFPLLRYVIKFKPDIIQIVTPDAFYLPLYLLKPFLGYKIVYLSHSIISYTLRYFLKINFLQKIRLLIIEKITLKFSDLLFVLSKNEARYLRRYLHCNENNLKIVDNGVNCLEYIKIYEDHSTEDILKIIFIGSTQRKEKGFDFLLSGLELLPIKVQLTICDYQKQLDISRKVPKNIILNLLDPLNEIELREKIIENDLLIIPSMHESFSLALLESMNTGILFISTNKVGLVERFPLELSRLVIPYGNSNKLKNKIMEIHFFDNAKKSDLSNKIKEFSLSFSWEKITENYYFYYKSLIR